LKIPGAALALAAAIEVALAGCGGVSHPPPTSEGSTQTYRPAPLGDDRTSQSAGIECARSTSVSPGTERAYAAVVREVAAAYARPGVGLLDRFGRIDENGYPTVFGVLGARMGAHCKPIWYRVRLPTPPNGSTGWVAAGTVRLYRVTMRIVVRLSTRRLVVFRSGKRVFGARVAVGTAQTPTPVGHFFVNERFLLDSPGPFGAAALGISAHSDVLKNWVQGGPIALHGTDDPASIGAAATHGCIRLANGDMRRLFALVPAGTPVSILR
jgi:lipoprotein-anchoring transpeptidase ErfK/SrfK